MVDLVFFYGTLMTGFDRRGRAGIDELLVRLGRGFIAAALFDLGIYPAAVPAREGRVWGEVHRMRDPAAVLAVLDPIEGFSAREPDTSLYTRDETTVTLETGDAVRAWAYFYNAPLGKAARIESGDYLEHLRIRRSLSV